MSWEIVRLYLAWIDVGNSSWYWILWWNLHGNIVRKQEEKSSKRLLLRKKWFNKPKRFTQHSTWMLLLLWTNLSVAGNHTPPGMHTKALHTWESSIGGNEIPHMDTLWTRMPFEILAWAKIFAAQRIEDNPVWQIMPACINMWQVRKYGKVPKQAKSREKCHDHW